MKAIPSLSSPKIPILGFVMLASVGAVLLDRAALAQSPKTVLGVECSRIAEFGIDKQENLRAGLIMVGRNGTYGNDPTGTPLATLGDALGGINNVDPGREFQFLIRLHF